MKILFVDDEPKMLKYFDRALSDHFSIVTADSVSNAIEVLKAQHQQIAVLITDQRMPERQGIELLQYAHANHPQIVRMLTTAFCEIDNAIDAINAAEVFRYIAKPWDLDDLSQVLQQGLDRFKSLQAIESHAPDAAEKLLNDLHQDCEAWFTYAGYAYGNEDVYRSGIEALANKYYRQAEANFTPDKVQLIEHSINELLEADFLLEKHLNKIRQQGKQGFGGTGQAENKKLH